jgi:predicted transcriptional regulator
MPPRRTPGLGAMRQIRQELKDATKERQDVDQRIRRLRAAEAALNGGRSPSAKVLNRAQLRNYLAKHPGARSLEIADALGVPPGSVRTLLSTMKKASEVTNERQSWYLTSPSS